MSKTILIDAHYDDETRIAVINKDRLLEKFEVEYINRRSIKGNIYLAKVFRIEPSIQAAFIDYGGENQGFLSISEIHHEHFKSSEIASNFSKPRIQDIISVNQVILVQAEKEGRGNKRPSFTTFINIPGKYCILTPNLSKGKTVGISKKIDEPERTRLRELIESLIPEGMSCIVRTLGENKTKKELSRDLEYLLRLWNKVKESTKKLTAPALIYEEGNIIKRTIRDQYKSEVNNIVIQGESAYKEAKDFMKLFTPGHTKRIEIYENQLTPIFYEYGIEQQIEQILDPIVNLPSGGSIVINKTEALTAIDVNSGRIRGERDLKGTALKINLEAAVEVAKQIELRDISGIIVVDFIDMESQADIESVENKMKEAISLDSSRVQISKISKLGLMEISRQRLRTSFPDNNLIRCPYCNGIGKILSMESTALSVIRQIEKFLVEENAEEILVEVASNIDTFILNQKRKLIISIENTYETSIEIRRNLSLQGGECLITNKVKAEVLNLKNSNTIEQEKLPNKENIKSYNSEKQLASDKPNKKSWFKRMLPSR
ncbi:MAG: Rne/Rng family ribonuclease [Holosporales bacterium]|jgi:ribonuclease E|nr:Rne/Rng family ribonuclease [Holosporales bacterium]